MTKAIQTICTIELSNKCNLQCKYCISRKLMRHPERSVGIMDDETFNRSLDLLQALVDRKTQKEVNLNGNGESTLDPQLIDRVRAVSKIMDGYNNVQFCTNGLLVTDELVKALKDAGLDRLDVSPHDAYHARKTVDICRRNQMNCVYNGNALVYSHNWADQLEPEHSVSMLPILLCDPLVEGRAYIQKEGTITPCCYSYDNKGVFTSVYDEDVLERIAQPYELCKSCHQRLPDAERKVA